MPRNSWRRKLTGVEGVDFSQTDALAKLLIDKGIITQAEFLAKIAAERATYQRMLNPTRSDA